MLGVLALAGALALTSLARSAAPAASGPVMYDWESSAAVAPGQSVVMYVEADPDNGLRVLSASSGSQQWKWLGKAVTGNRLYQLWLLTPGASVDSTPKFTYSAPLAPGQRIEYGQQVYGCVLKPGVVSSASGTGSVIKFPALTRSAGSLYWGYGKTSGSARAGAVFSYSITPEANAVAYGTESGTPSAPTDAGSSWVSIADSFACP